MTTNQVNTIGLKSLIVDLEIQQRANHLDDGTVQEYKEAAGEGWDLPAVTVFVDGESGEHWLADGFHRVKVAEALNFDEIPAKIHEGTRRDAVLYAVGANAEHGLRRTNADKRRAVRTLLEDDEWSKLSNREIAKQCRVHHQLVANVLAEMENQLDDSSSSVNRATAVDQDGNAVEVQEVEPGPVKRRGADGKMRDTSGISKSNRQRAKAKKPTSNKKATKQESQLKQSAQQVHHRVDEACRDLRTVDLPRRDWFTAAQILRDTLISVLPKLDAKDAAAMKQKVADAEIEGATDA